MSRSEEVITRAMAVVAASRALRQREMERRAARKAPPIVLSAAVRKYSGAKSASEAGRN